MTRDSDAQTRRSFQEKWAHHPDLAFRQTLERGSDVQQWILNRNGYADYDDAKARLAAYRKILDAGCGNGRVTALLSELAPAASIVGVDLGSLDAAKANTERCRNVTLKQADLRQPLEHLGTFDFIYCQEVLHHTGDAPQAFANLARLLAPGGVLATYVYRKKAPAREYMDDYVRAIVAELPYERAMETCRRIAELGRRLASLPGELEVEDLPELGIEKGRYSAQRLLYNFFLKCYWNDGLSAEENAAVNFDWYHPQNCTRHTMTEVLGWYDGAGLEVVWRHQDPYGITVHGKRR